MLVIGLLALEFDLRWIFVESMKTIHFWKPYSITIQKNNVSIFPKSYMSAILDFTKWLL